jgi:hypothetical protein
LHGLFQPHSGVSGDREALTEPQDTEEVWRNHFLAWIRLRASRLRNDIGVIVSHGPLFNRAAAFLLNAMEGLCRLVSWNGSEYSVGDIWAIGADSLTVGGTVCHMTGDVNDTTPQHW